MDNKKKAKAKAKANANRVAAYALSGVMLASMIPYNVFANPSELDKGIANYKNESMLGTPSTAPRAAEEPEKSDTDKGANNAVHGYVGLVQGVNIDQNMSKVTGEQFTPKAGIDVYFQWYEGLDGPNQYTSPVYKATSGTDGQFHMAVKPYIAPDGKLIKFDADTTVSAGNERYKFWVDEKTIPEGYALQYITGEGVVFPDKGLPVTQGGAGSNTVRNIHGNWKVLLRELPKEDMHKTAKKTPIQQDGGYIFGKVSWDYDSDVGGIEFNQVANHTTPAPDVTIKASYLSDYAMKQIYSNKTAVHMGVSKPADIRGSGWTVGQENKLQDWIREKAIADPDNWIAETVTAKTNAKGDYILQFNGIWGEYKNADAALKTYKYKVGDYVSPGNRWTQEQLNRLGSLATDASDGDFVLTTAAANKAKHINYDWLFVSADDTDGLRVMTPYSKNQYTSMNSDWGIHAGWSGTGFGVGVDLAPRAKLRADFAIAPVSVDFNITNYDSGANTAIPGDVAETLTEGLPYSHASDSYRIVWYDESGKVAKTGTAQKPDETGKLKSEPLDTTGITKTTNFTAKLYRLDSKGNNKDLLGQDSFSVQISRIVVSAYDDVKISNPAYGKKGMEGAKFYSNNLPEGLSINENTGEITGKATQPGKYTVTIKTIVPDKDLGDIEGTKDYTALVTDSPLPDGEVGKEYSQTVKPTKIDGYVFKNVSAKFADDKQINGLTISVDKITGKPVAAVDANQVAEGTKIGPNVEVTYDIYKLNDKGQEVLIKEKHVDKVPLKVVEAAEKEADKYTPTADPVEKDKGTAVTEKDVTDAVKVPDFVENPKFPGQKPVVTVDDASKLPDGKTPGKTDVAVTVTYPDGSTDKLTVPVTINDTTKPSDNDTSVDTSGKHPVDPTNEDQGTGVVVNNPDKDTKITAEDEDGKNVPVAINPNTGEIEVTPGADVDGPIVVTIEDPDLPGGKTTIIIDVNGHSMLRDDNGNGYIGENGYNPDNDYYIFPGGKVKHDYTPTYPVKTVVPEKTSVGTPVHDTLWYVFHINEYEYEVVRNGVVTKRLMDVTPVLRNNRTMLPLRYVAEAIGADVKWDAKTRTATFTKDGLTASIQVDGNEIVLSNGKTIKMDSKPLMLNNRVLVSVVNVANVFGLTNGNTLDGSDQDIEWNQNDKSATIYIRR